MMFMTNPLFSQEQNFTIAFEEAEKVGIPRLLVSLKHHCMISKKY